VIYSLTLWKVVQKLRVLLLQLRPHQALYHATSCSILVALGAAAQAAPLVVMLVKVVMVHQVVAAAEVEAWDHQIPQLLEVVTADQVL
jgi:hypothetical protein